MAAASTKTVKYQGSFAVVDAAGVSSPNVSIKDLTLTVSQVQTSDPMCISANTVDFQIPFGAITSAKRILLDTDQSVTVKVNQNTDTGFSWNGLGVLPSADGITNLYISTGPNDTNVTVVVAGD